MKYLILISCFLGSSLGQLCSHPQETKQIFGNYLNCLKSRIDTDYVQLEAEIRSDNRKAAGTCFAPTISEANAKDRCVLALSDLDSKAWDRNGPLRDCSICRTFAASAIKALLNTPPEDQKCIRREISKSIAKEAEFCLKQKISDFAGIPEIPDLEEGSFNAKEQVIDSISDYILINSRLSFCAERKPKRAMQTRRCLSNPFAGFYKKHCNAISSCDAAVNGGCLSKLQESKVATCACIDEARQELKKRISGIADAINEAINSNRGGAPAIGSGSKVDSCVANIKQLKKRISGIADAINEAINSNRGGAPAIGSGSKVDSCVANIKRQLITPVNDWAATIDYALNTCIKSKPTGQSLGIDSLLNVGCRKVIADTTGTATSQLKTGFDFVNNLIDAMVERSRRFCGGEHCQH
uniref:Uncharacterized protein n=1 Tax=Panagrolaimus sp. JU765 TaxID=591449 RepID=A0AC34QIZ4_9BILA